MIACLFSGGKDSTLALHKMAENGKKAELLITMISDNAFSFMFHKPNIDYTAMQAEALGIPRVTSTTRGEKERELVDLEAALKKNKVTELITGAVASVYQKDRIEKMCRELGIECHSPLWGIAPLDELSELSTNFEVIVSQVAAEGFGDDFLGARIDEAMIKKLVALHKKYKINMLFEGGEAESFVLDAPLFKKRIEVRKAHKEWDGSVGRYLIDEAVLVNKNRR
jgi:diphthine-ammonia ligase